MKQFLLDVQEGYYILQILNKTESQAKSETKYIFPFIFLGYYIGVMALLGRVLYSLLNINYVPHTFINYLTAVVYVVVPYTPIYFILLKNFGYRDVAYEKGKAGNTHKIWKFILFFALSLLALFIFPISYDWWMRL